MPRILVVEDDPAQQFLYLQLLRRDGYEAIGAEDADSAFAVLSSQITIDAILTDMSMPGLHGVAFIQALRAKYPHIPVVMMSVRGARDWCLEAPAGYIFLQKPFARSVLNDALRAVLSGRGKTAS